MKIGRRLSMRLLGMAVTGLTTARGRGALVRRILFGAAVMAPLIHTERLRNRAAEPVQRTGTAEAPAGEIGIR